MIDHILDEVHKEYRFRQIDPMVKPYAYKYSMSKITTDLNMCPTFHDKRYDDGQYEKDPTIFDMEIPKKDDRAIHDPSPG